jgi:hypothetical protein
MKKSLLKISAIVIFLFTITFSLIACDSDILEAPKTLKEANGTLYMVVDNGKRPSTHMGEYHNQYFNKKDDSISNFYTEVLSLDEYKEFCDKLNITQKYSDNTKNYIVFSYFNKFAKNIDAYLIDVDYEDTKVQLFIREDITYDYTSNGGYGYVFVIPTTKKVTEFEIIPVVTEDEFEDIELGGLVCDKPVIYIYPEEEMSVKVELGYPNQITCSYPKYNNGWNVFASPNGTLKDTYTNRELYALYYEAIPTIEPQMTNEGFVIKGEDSIAFLEEKLAILGLNEREAEEFIIYWLPILESNEYNYIRFATKEEINEMIPLEITPMPDTTIRVIMFFKGLDEKIEVNKQTLVQQNREGFTVVEWGGCKLK